MEAVHQSLPMVAAVGVGGYSRSGQQGSGQHEGNQFFHIVSSFEVINNNYIMQYLKIQEEKGKLADEG